MGKLRLQLKRHRVWAMWLVAAAVLMKIAIPAGYMPVVSTGSIAIELCSGFGPETMAMAMPGMAGDHGKSDHQGHDDMPCGFAGHAPAALASVDPILLVTAIAWIIATRFRMPVAWPLRQAGFLRPPSRGPPPIA